MAEQTTPIVEAAHVNAFVTAQGCGNGRGVSLSSRGGSVVNQRGFFPHNNNQRPNFAWNGEKFTTTGEKLNYQICEKQGHHALDCYQRMNVAYERRIPAKRLIVMATSSITINKQHNGQWLLDTGANAHVTPDLQNLVNPKEYNSNENVGGVGNDTGLSISHLGSNKIQTQSCSFELKNILRCPTAFTEF